MVTKPKPKKSRSKKTEALVQTKPIDYLATPAPTQVHKAYQEIAKASPQPAKPSEAWEIAAGSGTIQPTHHYAAAPDEVTYTFKTEHGTMKVSPRDIMAALEEQSKTADDNCGLFEEDLRGWGVIHAKNEFGESRPLFLMRILPGTNVPVPYSKVRDDDNAMAEIVVRKVYGLTPMKIRWLKLRPKLAVWFNKYYFGWKKLK